MKADAKKALRRAAGGLPISIWMLILVILPLVVVVQYSFYLKIGGTTIEKDIFSLANYYQFFANPIYSQIFIKTLLYAFLIAMISLLLGYPLAYLVSRKLKRFRNQFFLLILVPLWVSYLVRIIAWRTILGKTGVINSVLLTLGIIDEPISWLIYSPFAVVITLVHITLPFVFIPVFNALEKIPNNLIAAAADLGANGFRQFVNVIFPLSLPGVLNGFTMAFVISLGDYIIPKQLGGTTMTMFGSLIADQFGQAYNWPLGSALGFILFIVAVAILLLSARVGKSEGFME
ncbi:MAG: ABC transporter permease [Clostridiales bacterium]|nr:ABC transporter permease [Clostridiales bacterium]